MAESAGSFDRQLIDMGLPPEAAAVMLAAVRSAGFDADQESERSMGLAAVVAAMQVHDAATRVVARARQQVGRNDPCPCGSGRKFKKCCQGKAKDAPTEAPSGPPSPLDAPDLIPRMHDPERFAEDMDTLDRLFGEDPDLRSLRFRGPDVLAFVADDLGEEAGTETGADDEGAGETEDADTERLEEWVSRYLREEEGIESLGEVENALLAAASRHGQSATDLRALALGVALAGMPEETEEDEGEAPANPLHVLIFRRTLEEALKTQELVEELIERSGGAGALRRRLRAGEPLPLEGLAERISELPAFTESALEAVEETLWSLGDDIREGLLPVGLSLPSLLPCLTRFALAAGDRELSDDEAFAILTASAEELGPEDAALLDQALEGWLEENQEDQDLDTLERIAFLRSELLSGSLGPFAPDLLAAALTRGDICGLEGEPEAPEDPETARGRFTAEYLERYGDFLWDQELPELARRTWLLCELHGPLTPALGEKLARRAPFEEDADEGA